MKLEERVEVIIEKLDEVSRKQSVHSAILKEHVRRTNLLEATTESIREEMQPIKIHVALVGSIAKVLAVIGTMVAIAVCLKNILG